MKCENARKVFYTTVLSPLRLLAGRHMHVCKECCEWNARLQMAEAVLDKLSRHKPSAMLSETLRARMFTKNIDTDEANIVRPARAARKPLVVAGVLLVAFATIAALWMIWGRTGEGAAWAEMSEALQQADIVHITGYVANQNRGEEAKGAAFQYKDKWLSRNPRAYREEIMLLDYLSDEEAEAKLIVVGDAEKTYWYWVERNAVSITKTFPFDFIEELTRHQGWDKYREDTGAVPIVRRAVLNGRPVIISEVPADAGLFGEEATMRIYIDAQSKLVARAEAFVASYRGGEAELMCFDFEYNVPAPAGTFEFVPPEGASIKDKR